jgi:hypothetical protein
MLTAMLQRFLETYPLSDGPDLLPGIATTPAAVRRAAGGRTFASGLYRVHTEQSATQMARYLDAAFLHAAPHTAPYGYDWLGRQFCARHEGEDSPTLIFEPGTGEILDIPVPFSVIHEQEFVDFGDAALARGFFNAYLDAGGLPPRPEQCIGYRTPLFLGGADVLDNLELVDLDVYWHLSGQLIRVAIDLTPGTHVGPVTGG